MRIKWLGHACFEITTKDGTVIVTDPFDASVGYPVPRSAADIVTESHQHHDHNDVSNLEKADLVLSEPCDTRIGGVRFSTVSAYHDDANGAKRGPNLLFVIEADGLKIAHLGDLGHDLNEEQLAPLRGADVLFLPIGGFYTIGAEQAERIRRQIQPRLTIPMHFLTPAIGFPIGDEKPFLALNGGQYAKKKELEIDGDSISQLPEVLVLDY